MLNLSDVLLVPQFRKALAVRGLTKTVRLVNRDGANAIQDCGFSPILSDITSQDIEHLAQRFGLVGIHLQTLRIKTTSSDNVQECDQHNLNKLISDFRPFIGAVTRIVVRSATNLDSFFPKLFMCSSMMVHINISAQPSTVEMWTLLPPLLLTLRCSLQAGPLWRNDGRSAPVRFLTKLKTVSDHGHAPIGVDIIGGILHIAPNLRKLVRKQQDGVGFFVTDADDLQHAVDTMEYLEQRISAGLATDHQDSQNFNVYLAFDSHPDKLCPFLWNLITRHPMAFASSVVVLVSDHEQYLMNERLAVSFPKANVTLVPT